MSSTDLHGLIGDEPSSQAIQEYLSSISKLVSNVDIQPDIKSYPDCIYFNYYTLGVSLLFAPKDGYKPAKGASRADLRDDRLALDGIDIYNVPQSPVLAGKSKADTPFSTYPVSPVVLNTSRKRDTSETSTFCATEKSTGKDFVEFFGEPTRKGGGAGPSSGSINIWCEWAHEGLMVEFGGDEARGPQAWERGKDARWNVAQIFSPRS